MSRFITCGALVALLFAATGAGAGDDIKHPRVPLDKVPEPVLDAVKTRFPAADMSRAFVYDEGLGVYYEIMIKDRGQKIDVLVAWVGIIVKDITPATNMVTRSAVWASGVAYNTVRG